MLLVAFLILLSSIELSEQKFQKPAWPCENGTLHFASSYGDHVVLQKSPERAGLWGCGPPGDDVIVYLQGPTTQKTQPAAVSNETGMWRVTLDPVEAGGPYTITVVLANSVNIFVTLKDVLFGDVWLCSGQSNMYFEVSQIFNSSEELALAPKYPHVRIFTAGLITSDKELPDLSKVDIPWSVPDEKNLAPFSAVCWLFGRYLYETLQYPIGLVESSWGGTDVEAWSSLSALEECGLGKDKEEEEQFDKFFGPRANSVLWNAMIHPLLKMTIKGAIWYQGEANTDYHKDVYNCSFPAMIDDWRASFHRGSENQTAMDFPFGFVQLSTYLKNSTDESYPEIRWHQTADYGYVPNFRMKRTFMAVAMDLPDETSPYGTIHPRDKQDVALRLTLGAKAVAYNHILTFNGPFPLLIMIRDTFVYIRYDQPLSVTPSEDIFEVCCSSSFTLCGPKSKWVSAPMKEWDDTTVQLYTGSCPYFSAAAAVRYAWRDWPCDFKACPIYSSKTSLPAPSFIINFESSSGWKRAAPDNFLYSDDLL